MKWLSLSLLGPLSLFLLACEPHPLPGEPPASDGHGAPGGPAEQHAGGEPPSPAEHRDAAAQPSATAPQNQQVSGSELARPEDDKKALEERKFFPEKK